MVTCQKPHGTAADAVEGLLSFGPLIGGATALDHTEWACAIRASALIDDPVGAVCYRNALNAGRMGPDAHPETILGRCALAGPGHMDAALRAAQRAADEWGGSTQIRRAALAEAFRARLREHADALPDDRRDRRHHRPAQAARPAAERHAAVAAQPVRTRTQRAARRMGCRAGGGKAVTRSDILAAIKSLLAEFGDVDPEEVDEQTAFVADLGLDSLVLVRMTVAAEERFGVRIPEEVAWELETVGAVAGYVEDALTERTGRLGAGGE